MVTCVPRAAWYSESSLNDDTCPKAASSRRVSSYLVMMTLFAARIDATVRISAPFRGWTRHTSAATDIPRGRHRSRGHHYVICLYIRRPFEREDIVAYLGELLALSFLVGNRFAAPSRILAPRASFSYFFLSNRYPLNLVVAFMLRYPYPTMI